MLAAGKEKRTLNKKDIHLPDVFWEVEDPRVADEGDLVPTGNT